MHIQHFQQVLDNRNFTGFALFDPLHRDDLPALLRKHGDQTDQPLFAGVNSGHCSTETFAINSQPFPRRDWHKRVRPRLKDRRQRRKIQTPQDPTNG